MKPNDSLGAVELTNQPRFQAGDRIVLRDGPHKFVSGTFLHLNDDVKWASIEQSNGDVRSHPVEWMQEYPDPKPTA